MGYHQTLYLREDVIQSVAPECALIRDERLGILSVGLAHVYGLRVKTMISIASRFKDLVRLELDRKSSSSTIQLRCASTPSFTSSTVFREGKAGMLYGHSRQTSMNALRWQAVSGSRLPNQDGSMALEACRV